MRIGLDLDNTIIDYDGAFITCAMRAGLGPFEHDSTKRAVRDHLRTLPDGETKWTRLQAEVYGPAIHLAKPAEGVRDFLSKARALRAQLFIISHKTQFAAASPQGVDLRRAAFEWLEKSGLLACGGIDQAKVIFTDSRDAKVGEISSLNLEAFVDDLPEVLTHPGFPPEVRRLHYSLQEVPHAFTPPLETCRGWAEVGARLFGPKGRSH